MTAPGAKLHISAGDSSLALFGPNASWGGKLYVGASPNQAVAAQVISTDGNLHLDPAPSKNMYLGYYQPRDIYINPNGGNVGIGTTSPGRKLDVNGALKLADEGTKPICDSTTRGTVWVDFGVTGAGATKDTVEVCAKDAADAYAWRTIY